MDSTCCSVARSLECVRSPAERQAASPRARVRAVHNGRITPRPCPAGKSTAIDIDELRGRICEGDERVEKLFGLPDLVAERVVFFDHGQPLRGEGQHVARRAGR